MQPVKFLVFSALFFYALCWFIDQPTELLWYAGISLPWASLIIAVFPGILFNKNDATTNWGYCYAASTIAFVIFASIKSMQFLQQVPYLASCVSFIACTALSNITTKNQENEETLHNLKEKCKLQFYRLSSLTKERRSIIEKTNKIIKDQEEYNDEIDEIILLARNKVMFGFLKKLSNELTEDEKTDRDLYDN